MHSNQQQPFAEIIESSLTTWRAQAWQWDYFARFGALTTIETPERVIFGLVYSIETGSRDPGRTAYAYKKTEAELRHEQPQIFEFLQTTFSCVTLGYLQDTRLLYQLAPEPPKIHSFVTHAQQQHITAFFSSEQYLHILFEFAHQFFSLDELLLALLKNLSDQQALTHACFTRFIETFSLLTANDYRRLKLFLQRAQTSIHVQVQE